MTTIPNSYWVHPNEFCFWKYNPQHVVRWVHGVGEAAVVEPSAASALLWQAIKHALVSPLLAVRALTEVIVLRPFWNATLREGPRSTQWLCLLQTALMGLLVMPAAFTLLWLCPVALLAKERARYQAVASAWSDGLHALRNGKVWRLCRGPHGVVTQGAELSAQRRRERLPVQHRGTSSAAGL